MASEINFTLTKQELQTLATLAIGAKRRAYCPYSNFRVGACLILESAQSSTTAASPDTSSSESSSAYHTGSNVEVASTPVGTCAERCALAPVVAGLDKGGRRRGEGMPRIRGLAVSTDIWGPASPCGMCRQMIREFCDADMKVYMYGRQPGQSYPKDISPEEELRICGEPVIMTTGELLPMSFGPNDMDKREVKTPNSG